MSLMPFIQDCACCVRFFLAVSLHPTVPYLVHGDWRCALTGAKQLCFLGHVAGWWREGGCGIKKRATSKDIGSVRPQRRIWCHAVVALNQVVNCRHQQKNIVSGYVFFKWGPFHCWCLISPGDGLLKEPMWSLASSHLSRFIFEVGWWARSSLQQRDEGRHSALMSPCGLDRQTLQRTWKTPHGPQWDSITSNMDRRH